MRRVFSWGLALAALQGAAALAQPVAVVDALEGLFGVHDGARRSQAKGLCAQGAWLPSAQARGFSAAPVFAAGRVPALLRFSVGGGSPSASDKSRSARGLSLRLTLPNGQVWDQANLSTPVYFVRDPAHFAEFVKVRTPDPLTGKVNTERLKAFGEAHPETLRQGQFLAQRLPPASYASTSYYGINAFQIRDRQGLMQHVRWQYQPAAGDIQLAEADLQRLPEHFLRDELAQRLLRGPVSFEFQLQIAEPSDDVTDPTVAWPSERRKVAAGQLVVETLLQDDACDAVMFNPLSLPAGIEPSADPVLLARPGAYAVSLGRRQAGSRR